MATVQKYQQRPTNIGVTTSPGKITPGKTIVFIQCSLPACVQLDGFLKQAASAVGWKVTSINAGSGADPATIKNAWEQAVTDHPDAVIGTGFDRSIMNAQIAQLAAAHIPVIMGSVDFGAGNGVTAVINSVPSFTGFGKAMANYAVAQAGSTPANTVFVNAPGYPIIDAEYNGFKAQYEADCSTCTLAAINIPDASIGTSDSSARVVAYLESHSSVNTVAVGFANMTDGLPEALKAASVSSGIKTMVTQDVDNPLLSYIHANTLHAATVEENWQEWMWRSVDLIIRQENGQSLTPDTDPSTVPVWLVNNTNVNAPSVGSTVADYQAQFKKLWGVS
jgi:ABC-type sugar transport system substrate-binding protein